MFLQTGLGLIHPLYYKRLVDDVLNTQSPRGDLPLFLFILTILAGLRLSTMLLGMISSVLTTKISILATNALQSDIFTKLNHLPMRYHDRHAPGEIFPRLYSDPSSLIGFFMGSLPNLVTSIIKAIVVFFIILSLMWWAGIIAVLPIIPIYFISRFNMKYFRELSERMHKKQQMLYMRVLDLLHGIRIVRIFNRTDEELEQFNSVQRDVFKLSMESTVRSTWMSPLIGTLGQLGGGIVFMFGACQLLHFISVGSTTFTLGSLFMLMSYVSQLSSPISNLANFSSQLGSLHAASIRVRELLDEPIVEVDTTPPVPNSHSPAIECAGIQFEYERGKPILQDISFRIEPGELVGLVGPSGSGKTTILNLLCGFYEPTAGGVLIQGCRPNDLIANTREQPVISLAMQDGGLMQGSIIENLRYAKRDATEQDIWDALDRVEATEFVKRLPNGIETRVGEGANLMSSGQMQRLALARALIAESDILILDEATSWVDLWTEQRIFQRLLKRKSNQTILCISHRLHLMQIMDRILVLKNGKLVSNGTHQELLRTDEFYAATWHLRDVDGYDDASPGTNHAIQ